MAMGRQATNVLGSVLALGILAGAAFGVAVPILNEKSSNETQLTEAKQLNAGYVQRLAQFSSEAQSPELQQATSNLEEFKQLVPGSIDIESASRAIAGSLPSGVKLGSFSFGASEQVSSLKLPEPTLSGFTAPTGFGTGGSESSNSATGSTSSSSTDSSTAANGAANGFTRIPFTIAVTAGNYDELAEYLNQLSDQPRLISVVSVDSTRSDSAVTATVYAYAFANS